MQIPHVRKTRKGAEGMKKLKPLVLAGAVMMLLLAFAAPVSAHPDPHFTMLLPGEDMEVSAADYIATLGETKTVTILWGHPYEHQLFDCPVVPEVQLRDPEGGIAALTPTEVTVEGKKAYRVSFTIENLGDHILTARLVAEEHGLIDYTKTVIHCGEEAWMGWDAEVGQEVEIIPFTRPYGLEEGFVFAGKALLSNGAPLAGAIVEVEVYHTKSVGDEVVAEAEERFREDPPMMFTRVTTTNSLGEFSYTLDEPGIWFIGVTKEVEGGLDQRAVMVVPVLEAFPAEAPTEAGGTSGWAYAAFWIAIVAFVLGSISLAMRRR